MMSKYLPRIYSTKGPLGNLIRAAAVAIPLSSSYFLYTRAVAQKPKAEAGEPVYAAAKGEAPGEPTTTKTKMLETGAALLQSKAAVHFHQYLCAFHHVNGEPNRQVEAQHFCTHVNEDLSQCILFDENKPNAKLIGVEYVISRKLFETLPMEERKFWHSHSYEVTSGQLVLPGIPGPIEHKAAEELAPTYGKAWHLWQIDKGDPLPYGPPALVMSFTADGQLNPALLEARDRKLGVSTADKAHSRKDIPRYKTLPGADLWEEGIIYQATMKEEHVKNARQH